MRDLTYPPIILAAKTGFRILGQGSASPGTSTCPAQGGVLLAVNHIGYVDFVYGGLAANPSGRKVRFMAKRELFDHRWTGPLMRSMHHIKVDRAEGEASLRTATDLLRAGEAVGIFPEATISRALELKEFKTGAVRIAAEAGVPVGPGDPVGNPADDDQGPPSRLLPRQDDHDQGRDAAAPDRRRPGRRDRRAAPGDVVDARRGDPGLPGGGAAARVAGGCRAGTAAAPRPSRRPPSWTRPRRPSGRPDEPPRTRRKLI